MILKWKTPVTLLIVGFSLGWVVSVARYGIDIHPFPPPHGPPPGGPPPLSKSTMKAANISDVQIENILKVQDSGKKKIEEAIQKVQKAKEEFERAVDTTQDLPMLKVRFQTLLDAKKQVDETHFEIGMQVHSTLTLDQSKALRSQMMKNGFPPRPPEGP